MKKVFIFTIAIAALIFEACEKNPPANNNNNNNSGTSNLKDTTYLNVAYDSDSRNIMDIYLPKGRDTNTPVLLMIHGGAWKAGDKTDMNGFMNAFKKEYPNLAIATMNYRYASNTNNVHHPQMMADIKSAMQHLVNNKNKYGYGNNYALMGASAGAQLAMIYSYTYNDFNNIKCVGDIFGPSIINDWSWYNTNNMWLGAKVGDILTEYVGQSFDTTAYKFVSPYSRATATTQPTIIFHGNLDPIVPVYHSQYLKGKLGQLGVTNEYYEYIGFHSMDANQISEAVKKMTIFFKKYL